MLTLAENFMMTPAQLIGVCVFVSLLAFIGGLILGLRIRPIVDDERANYERALAKSRQEKDAGLFHQPPDNPA